MSTATTQTYRERLALQPVLAAPMCGISDYPWRQLCREMGARMTYTQMVSSEGLVRGDRKTLDILDLDPEVPERDLAMQVFGGEAEVLGEACHILQGLGAVHVDLNMGCPARKITVANAGSALLRDPARVERIFRAMRAATRVPLTAKMRWDFWDGDEGAALEVARAAEEAGLDGVCLHARTRQQGYSGTANWELIGQLKAAVSIPVVGNGDVRRPSDALEMMRLSGCDAVMIGRGLIGDPWLYREVLGTVLEGRAETERRPPPSEERRRVMLRHAAMMVERRGPHGLVMFRKHAAAYLRGLPGARRMREQIMKISTLEELEDLLQDPVPEPVCT